jgi:hypothetical protein
VVGAVQSGDIKDFYLIGYVTYIYIYIYIYS